MSRAAKSVFFFGIYVISLGVFLVVAPNVLLKLFGVPETSEVWIRVVGVVVLLIGYYYVRAATNEEGMTKFFRWTIYTRSSVAEADHLQCIYPQFLENIKKIYKKK